MTHNREGAEATWVSIDGRRGAGRGLYLPKREGISDSCSTVGEFEDTVLSEMSRHERTSTVQVHLSEVPRGVRCIER